MGERNTQGVGDRMKAADLGSYWKGSPKGRQGRKKFSKRGQNTSFITLGTDFPGGAVVKNPPANAGDRGSIPAPGTHAVEQSSPCATTTEPAL